MRPVTRIVTSWSEHKRRRSAERQQTHLSRWRSNVASPPPWDERNALIASLIPERSSVLDVGAGYQSLKTLLRDFTTYQPCDVVGSSPDTWYLDFNRGIYPEVPRPFDFVVLSGVLEYAKSPEDLLEYAASSGRTVLVSYMPVSSEPKRWRKAQGWFNHLTEDELRHVFAKLGLHHERVGTCFGGQVVFRLGRNPELTDLPT